ncbi:MAG TPA: hypothetical protein ENI85_18235 [Deltaproteobacteria bacterium]|nr:hypothetical protein [Deltaproteobacteria bacterium]
MRAIAQVNRASGRTSAIAMDLTMRVGDREPIASGELITHPSGLARLELRGYGGRIDRYLLSGDELLAAKDGEVLERPQPMLQPLFLLQPDTEATLRAALRAFGVESDWIGIAPCGEQDCFVIGDPRLAVRSADATDDGSTEATVLDDPLAGTTGEADPGGQPMGTVPDESTESGALSGPLLRGVRGEASTDDDGAPEQRLIPRLWVDMQRLQVRRIDRAGGVFTVFGPMIHFDKLEVPAWFEIHEPGAQTIRFEVDRAVAVNAPPQAFSRKWLFAPVGPPAGRVPPAVPTPPTPPAASGKAAGAAGTQPGFPADPSR